MRKMQNENVMQLNLNKELHSASGCQFIGILSPKSKHLLTLSEDARTGVEFFDLLWEMENMKVFAMFSNRTKKLLAKKLKFVARTANEFLLKQGEASDPPQAFYIIVSGVVTEHYKPLHSDVEITKIWPEKILSKGEFFGHIDIVHNRPPTVDAQAVCYTELLMLPKDDFGIAREEMETHCTRLAQFLRTSKAISRFGWSDEEYKVLEIYSKLCTYVENQDIYSGVENNKPFWSYFVVLGGCKIMRELSYYISDSGNLKTVPYQSTKELKSDKLVKESLIEFEEVKQGYYFGVGESFIGNHIIARSTLECLLIPRLLLVFKDKELLQQMAKDLTNSLPSDQEVLDCYSKLVSASEKKVTMLRELCKEKPERLIQN